MRLFYRAIALVAALFMAGCSEQVLLGNLAEREANEIISALYQASIESQKVAAAKGEVYSVVVRADELPKAVAALQALGLPRKPRVQLNEIFGDGGFAPTPFEQRIRYTYGLSQELERTISLMDGALDTRVHVVIPLEENSRSNEKPDASASVFLRYDDRFETARFIPRIKQLVSDSVEGVQPNQVEVLALPTRVELREQSEIPIVRFLGVRLHKNDFRIYIIQFGTIIGLLAASLAMNILLQRRGRKQRLASGS